MQSSIRKPLASTAVSTDDDQAGLAGLMQSPWVCATESFFNIQSIYAAHKRSPKMNIEAFEKRAGFSLATPRPDYQVDDGGVAVIAFDGLMVPKANLLTRVCGATSAQWVTGQIKAALADPQVKAIVLAIDSPGGTIYGTHELASVVYEAARKKPLVAHSDAMLLSAAYWVGSAANAVYISGPAVNAGSIGVVMTKNFDPDATQNYTELFAGRYKQYTHSAKKPTKEAEAYLQEQVNYLYTVFVDAVATFRGVTPMHVNERMAEGRTFIGQRAIDAGLVDEIMSLGALVKAMASNPAAFAKRRRVMAHRVPQPGGSAAISTHTRQAGPMAPCVLTKTEQAAAAVAYAQANQLTIVQALKTLGYAT